MISCNLDLSTKSGGSFHITEIGSALEVDNLKCVEEEGAP